MKASGDLVIGRSGDRKNEVTVEARKRGEETCERLTTEAQRHGESRRNSVFFDHPITRSRAITRSSLVPAAFKRMILIVRATLREIFDESAYDRFLLRTQASRTTASYREFMRERDAALVKKPRCC